MESCFSQCQHLIEKIFIAKVLVLSWIWHALVFSLLLLRRDLRCLKCGCRNLEGGWEILKNVLALLHAFCWEGLLTSVFHRRLKLLYHKNVLELVFSVLVSELFFHILSLVLFPRPFCTTPCVGLPEKCQSSLEQTPHLQVGQVNPLISNEL